MFQYQQSCQFSGFDINCWSLDNVTTVSTLWSTQVFWRYRSSNSS